MRRPRGHQATHQTVRPGQQPIHFQLYDLVISHTQNMKLLSLRVANYTTQKLIPSQINSARYILNTFS